MPSRPVPAAVLAACLLAGAVGAAVPASAAPSPAGSFTRTATFPVYLNAPADVDPSAPTVAEISTITQDGTVVYTDALGKRIGFVDVTDPAAPKGTGTVSLADLGHADDQPTSVAAYGDYILVVIDETGGDYTSPRGRLDVLRASDRSLVRSLDLGGQPDSIAISHDGAYAAIAMENQRDEDATPEGGDEGDLPQLPGGFVQVLDLGPDPAAWSATPVSFLAEDGSPLPIVAASGIDTPQDPEPEYVTIDDRNQLAVTLQENNGIAIIDLATKTLTSVFSAGSVAVSGIDTVKDGRIDLTGSIPATPREPDAIAWVGDGLVATANEGDWKGGTRGWTVFRTDTGEPVWDAGASFANIAVQHGLHNEDRAAKKGAEPEGLAFAEFHGTPYVFVASERSNFVAVYDMSQPTSPAFVQLLFTTNGPEGILPVPERDLLVVSSETDDAEAGVRASVSVFTFGQNGGSQPGIVSDVVDGTPIGWSALGALSGHPTDASLLYAASDAVVSPATIYTVDVSAAPARIISSLQVHDGGSPIALDVEGIAAAADGGFWLAVEGAEGSGNQIVHTDAAGLITARYPLPADVAAHVGKWGFEGVTITGEGDGLRVWSVLQRPLWTDPADVDAGTVDGAEVARIGRLDPATGAWAWFGYRLDSTEAPGDWIGLSEITAIDDDTFALIERDKLNGPAAAVKRITRVDIPEGVEPSAFGEPLTVLDKTTAIDVLPALRTTAGWTQEKLEGFTVAADGRLYAVTDNDGLKDATGETVFLRLGEAAEVFPDDSEPAEPAAISLSTASVAAGGAVEVTGTGFPASSTVRIELHSDPVVLGTAATDADGALRFSATIPAETAPGAHEIVAVSGDVTARSALTVTAAASGGATAPEPGRGVESRPGDLATSGGDAAWVLPAVLGAGALVAAGALLALRRRGA
ncbi:esterase-like activity of phytase family protein [Microbacterium sp. XT11]|uniref:esterase-like activity of phytase family protein n=1 Tax=Microbacterium sp. XT11 TaxID=367477 RepID=UPI000836BDBA|nr:esterase-like activity of phytase family protein [Microbacterium sp. XT11]